MNFFKKTFRLKVYMVCVIEKLLKKDASLKTRNDITTFKKYYESYKE